MNIPNKTILNIFKYSKFYQSKFNISKNDYILAFYDNISKDITDESFIKDKLDKDNVQNIFKIMKSNLSHDISYDLLKENTISYFAIKKDYILSIYHIYFNEILKKKIELGQKNVKIKLGFRDFLSQKNIKILSKKKSSIEEITNYINEEMEFNNNIIKKLEYLLNSNIFINELYFDLEYFSVCYLNYETDILEYKENETNEERNILVNFKLKRAELINKILENNCKYITNMKYLIIEKKASENIDIIFPLVNLDKFENLVSLDLYILVKGKSEPEYDFCLTNNLNKIKHLKIDGYNLSGIYLDKKILDNLETFRNIKNKKCRLVYI